MDDYAQYVAYGLSAVSKSDWKITQIITLKIPWDF